MTPLRSQMIKAMQMHGFSPRAHQSYLAAVTDLARYHHRSPDTLAVADLNGYFEHLVSERKLAPASIRLALNAIRFLFVEVLRWPRLELGIAFPKRAQRIPELLTRAEVARILGACAHPRYRMMLTLCYGCGLRLSELLAVKVRDIDGERRLLRVEQGKGAKDRLVPISPTLLEQLRGYWHLAHPSHLFFPARFAPNCELSPTSVQKQYTTAFSADGSWHPATSTYLFAVRALSRHVRGGFVSRLRRAFADGCLKRIADPAQVDAMLDTLMGTDWVIYSRPCITRTETVVDYLGRYSHRIALSDRRLLGFENGRVDLAYKDYRDGEKKVMELQGEELLRRFLLHVLPKGFMRSTGLCGVAQSGAAPGSRSACEYSA